MGLNIRKGDEVVVLAGKDKGKSGKVITAIPKKSTVIVDGVNIVTKHQKPRQMNQSRAMAQTQTGLIKKPAPLAVAKVQLICPGCGKPTRVGHADGADGRSLRTCKKCGEMIDQS